jgi:hypothetical protein
MSIERAKREGTSEEKAKETCFKFVSRSAVLATDGFIVYDIQDEKGRTSAERPFPFRKTLDPAWYGSLFPELSGKDCIIYKCCVEDDTAAFTSWLEHATRDLNHSAFNLVGAPTSSLDFSGLKLKDACAIVTSNPLSAFGCVCIPERHMTKGTEATNMLAKVSWGSEWFITQGIYNPEPTIQLIREYADRCRDLGITPKKLILSFAPCGRAKTMTFIKWLGMSVPEETENRILSAAVPVVESINILCDILKTILASTSGCGVPIGINVESLSIFKEEIDAAHDLFQKLQVSDFFSREVHCRCNISSNTTQAILLNSRGSPWAVCWYEVRSLPLVIGRSGSRSNVSGMITAAAGATPERRQEAGNGTEKPDDVADLVSIGVSING